MNLEIRRVLYHGINVFVTIPRKIREIYGWSSQTMIVLVPEGKHAYRIHGYQTVTEAIEGAKHSFPENSYFFVKPIPKPVILRIRVPVCLQKKIDWTNPAYVIIDYSNPNYIFIKEHGANDRD